MSLPRTGQEMRPVSTKRAMVIGPISDKVDDIFIDSPSVLKPTMEPAEGYRGESKVPI